MSDSDANKFFSMAMLAYSSGDYVSAENHIGEELNSHPTNSAALHLLAQILLRQNKVTDALDALRRAAKFAPEQTSLLLDMAHVYQIMGRIPEAAECYRKCSELNPKDGYARELHTQSLLAQWSYALTKRKIGREASKSFAAKVYSGFIRTYLSGANILDIGYRGGFGEASPIVSQAIGIDLGYPGYDGIHLPFQDNSQDAIYTSHCLGVWAAEQFSASNTHSQRPKVARRW